MNRRLPSTVSVVPHQRSGTFRAVLLRHDGDAPHTLTLPSEVDRPPSRIRVPSDTSGVPTFEVYELVDDRGWPTEATFRLVATVPRSTDDVPPHERSRYGRGPIGELGIDDEQVP